jgi:hypothetical protein
MKINVFYCCHATGEEVPSSRPIPIDRDQAIDIAKAMLKAPKDFVGFTDKNDSTLQFVVEEAGSVWMEVPAPAERGSFGKSIAMHELDSVIGSMPMEFGVGCVPGMEFRPW